MPTRERSTVSLAARVVVDVEADLRARLHQLAGIVRKNVAVLPDGIFVQERLGLRLANVFLPDELLAFGDILNAGRSAGGASRSRAGPGLVSTACTYRSSRQAAVRDVVDPHVGSGGRRRRAAAGSRRSDRACRCATLRHRRTARGGGMSARLPFGAPWSTQAAIVAISCVGQRRIVLELLDADVALDVPGRHHARDASRS